MTATARLLSVALALLVGCDDVDRSVDANDILRVTASCGAPSGAPPGAGACYAPCDAVDETPVELTLCDDIECVSRTCDTRLCECVGGSVRCDGVTPTRECEPHRFEPALTITPALRDFGEVAQGAIYPTVTFRLENEGAADGRLQPMFEGLGSEALALAPGDCVSRVSPGEVCEIRVILVTSEPRRVAASLRLTEGLAVSVEGLVTAAPIDAGAVDAGLLDAHDAP